MRDVNVTRSLKNNGFSFEFPQSLWKTERFVISECKGVFLFNILNTFNWWFHFLVEVFVSFEMYFLQVWRRLGFTASNRILEPEWLPLFILYFQTLIILTQWYVKKSYPCLAWSVDVVFWLDVQFSPKPPGNGDSKMPEIKFHSWSLLRNDIVSFWFWGYRGDLRIELQAPVVTQPHKCNRTSSISYNFSWFTLQAVDLLFACISFVLFSADCFFQNHIFRNILSGNNTITPTPGQPRNYVPIDGMLCA